MKVAFNGVNREIVILPGVEELNVQIDLYSDWKEWVLEGDNAKYPAAFRTFGGDPTIENQFAPQYFFLINNWEIIASGVSVDIQTNLYTDAVGNGIVVDNASVTVRNSDAAVVDNTLDETLDYNGVVYIDTRDGNAGTLYPKGTSADPVNNLADAKIIGANFGINTFIVRGDLVVDQIIENATFRGGEFAPNLIFTGFTVSNSRFYQFNTTGTMSIADGDNIYFEECGIANLAGFNGVMNRCTLLDGTLRLSENNEPRFLLLADCVSGVSGLDYPIIEVPFGTYSTGTGSFATHSSDINIRHYSGGIGLTGSFTDGSFASIDLNPGTVHLLEGITGGEINIRGIGQLNNQILLENKNNILVDTSGFYYDVENTSQKGAYGDRVHIDTINGASGSRYPIGLASTPVNNLLQAIEIAKFYGLNQFELISPITIDEDISGYNLLSHRFPVEVYIDNATCSNTRFDNCNISGTFSALTNDSAVYIQDCIVGNLDNMYGIINNGLFAGEISLGENSINSFINCRSIIPGTDSPSICKYLGSTSSEISLNVRAYSGGLRLKDWNTPNDVCTIEYIAGRANIDNTCDDGTIVLRGVGTLNNESATASNLNLITNGFVDNNETDIGNIETELFRIGETTDGLSQSVSTIDNNLNTIGATISLIDGDVNYIVGQVDAQTVLLNQIAGLVQKNFRIFDQVYDNNGQLVSSTIRTYSNATNANNNTNPQFQYEMSADYDNDGRLIDYKVIQV